MYQTRPRKQESPCPHQHHSTPSLKEFLLILRPLTHLSGGVIPFSRESVDSLAGSPLSLFTFMVRDSIRSLVLPLVAFKKEKILRSLRTVLPYIPSISQQLSLSYTTFSTSSLAWQKSINPGNLQGTATLHAKEAKKKL